MIDFFSHAGFAGMTEAVLLSLSGQTMSE